MITFIGRRALQAIPTLFILISICFFLVRLAPGGPFDGERVMSAQIKANILKAYHLDQPVYKQYIFIGKIYCMAILDLLISTVIGL